jgi:CRP-like cAMP-binding protein
MTTLTPIDHGLSNSNLLDNLHAPDKLLLQPYTKLLQVRRGEVLYEPGDIVKYAYFPCGSTLISFLVLLDDARGVETALVGREGAVGGIVSEGRLPAYCRAVVQFPGPVLQVESARLEEAKSRSLALRHFFGRYADCLLAQVFQSVACNATHTIEQRTAKWLLAVMDRTGNHVLPLTQDQLSGMLGVGRSYVARVLSRMKALGIVESLRGTLLIHEMEKLKTLSCNCNGLIRSHFNEVLSGVYPVECGNG